MSNDSRENLQGTDGQDAADLTAAAGQAVPEPTAAGQAVSEPTAAAAVDASAQGASASSMGAVRCPGRSSETMRPPSMVMTRSARAASAGSCVM